MRRLTGIEKSVLTATAIIAMASTALFGLHADRLLTPVREVVVEPIMPTVVVSTIENYESICFVRDYEDISVTQMRADELAKIGYELVEKNPELDWRNITYAIYNNEGTIAATGDAWSFDGFNSTVNPERSRILRTRGEYVAAALYNLIKNDSLEVQPTFAEALAIDFVMANFNAISVYVDNLEGGWDIYDYGQNTLSSAISAFEQIENLARKNGLIVGLGSENNVFAPLLKPTREEYDLLYSRLLGLSNGAISLENAVFGYNTDFFDNCVAIQNGTGLSGEVLGDISRDLSVAPSSGYAIDFDIFNDPETTKAIIEYGCYPLNMRGDLRWSVFAFVRYFNEEKTATKYTAY